MMTNREITAWLNTLPEDAEIGIDDGGMALQVLGEEEYLEVGCMPEDDAEYSNTVDNHCPECGEFESECTCGEIGRAHV